MTSLWTMTLAIVMTLVPASLTINTVPELKTAKYLGRWYQMYASPVVDLWFELGAICVTADYGVNPNGSVSVLNQERVDQPNGTLKIKNGFATPTNETGKLQVQLQGVPFVAPYWVVKLGPETYGDQGLYQYSVVTDSLSLSLFVLARDVDTFRGQYKDEVLDFLDKNGFNNLLNLPLETVQNKDCQYGPVPPKAGKKV